MINNVNAKYGHNKVVVKNINNKIRKKLITIDVKKLTWEEKKNIIQTKLIDVYGDIPNGISFIKIRSRDIINNIDGLRLLVKCDWIKRNRFFDYNGVFHFGTLINAINKEIEGTTKQTILK